MKDFYEKAHLLVQKSLFEDAITEFIKGLDRGDVRCAYGLIYVALMIGSHTLSYYEATEIFEQNYDKIRALAENGDSEAMLIVAESARYGFAECEEPYMFWLMEAAKCGNARAKALICEIEREDDTPLLGCGLPVALAEGETTDVQLYLEHEDYRLVEYSRIADVDDDVLEDLDLLPGKGKVGIPAPSDMA
jgi:hypothetical protein